MKKLIDIIEGIDTIGPQRTLNTNSNNHTYRTLLGGILSLLSVCSIFAFSVYFAIEVFTRENINVVFHEVDNDKPFYDFAKFPIAVALTDESGLYEFQEKETLYNITLVSRLITEDLKEVKENIPMVPCTTILDQIDSEYKMLLEKIMTLPNYLCVDPSSVKDKPLFNKMGGYETNRYYSLYFNKCSNTTTLNNCKPDAEIITTLSDVYTFLIIPDYRFDEDDLDKPAKLFTNVMSYSFSPTIFTSLKIRIKNINYITDYGMIFEDNQVENVWTLEDKFPSPSVQIRDDGIFPGNWGVISIGMTDLLGEHFRDYPKIQDLLADIGGIAQVIFSFTSFIGEYFIRKFYLVSLYNDFFNNDEYINNTLNNKRTKYIKVNNKPNNLINRSLTIHTVKSNSEK